MSGHGRTPADNDAIEARTEARRCGWTEHEERYGLDAPSRDEAEADERGEW